MRGGCCHRYIRRGNFNPANIINPSSAKPVKWFVGLALKGLRLSKFIFIVKFEQLDVNWVKLLACFTELNTWGKYKPFLPRKTEKKVSLILLPQITASIKPYVIQYVIYSIIPSFFKKKLHQRSKNLIRYDSLFSLVSLSQICRGKRVSLILFPCF